MRDTKKVTMVITDDGRVILRGSGRVEGSLLITGKPDRHVPPLA